MTCKWIGLCPLRKHEKDGVISLKWRKDFCESEMNWKECKRYQMEENSIPHRDNMMPDGSFVDVNDIG
jgi:hypothetical protein